MKEVNKYYQQQIVTENDTQTIIIWHPLETIDNLVIKQTSGFCFIKGTRNLILVRDWNEKRFTLPGGGVEKDEASLDAFTRETYEEAQCPLEDVILLGTLEIKILKNNQLIDHHQQHRYVANVDELLNFIPRKDGFETEERKVVSLDEIDQYIDWVKFPTGKKIYQMVLDLKNNTFKI